MAAKRKCELCGAELRSNNRSGLCSRPECVREKQRRYYVANRDRIRLAYVRRRLLRGLPITGRTKDQLVCEFATNWRGGRICLCDTCGKCLGWRNPSRISERGTFCKEHAAQWRKHRESEGA